MDARFKQKYPLLQEIATGLRANPFVILVLLMPFSLFIGKSATDILVSASAILFIYQSWRKQEWAWAHQRWFLALWAVWLYMLIRAPWTAEPLSALKTATTYGRYFVFSGLISSLPFTQRWARILLLSVLYGVVLFICIDTMTQYIWGANLFNKASNYGSRLVGPFNRPYVGVYLSWLSFPLVSHLFQQVCDRTTLRQSIVKLVLFLSFSCLTFMTIYSSGERTALLGTLLCYSLMILFGLSKKRFLLGLIVLVSLILRIPAAKITKELLTSKHLSSIPTTTPTTPTTGPTWQVILQTIAKEIQLKITSSQSSYQTRGGYGPLFQDALRLARKNIIFGVGPNQFQHLCHIHHDPKPDIKKCAYRHPHNAWLTIFAELGLIGVTLFGAFFFTVAWRIKEGWHHFKCNGLVIGLLCVLIYRFFPLAGGMSIFLSNNAHILWLLVGWLMCFLNKDSQDKASHSIPQ